jgi:hypothetical protein
VGMGVLSLGCTTQLPHPPSPPWCVWGRLEAGFYRKYLVLRNMEAKFIKKKNLRGFVFGMEPGATPRGSAEHTTLTNRVAY